MWEYIVDNGAWSAGGFAIGYLFGRIEKDIRAIKKKVNANDDDA